jgi:hypothetical protein
MNGPTCAVVVLAGLAAGCELVAGIQDKYLTAADTSVVVIPASDTGGGASEDSTGDAVARTDATDLTTRDAAGGPDSPQTIPLPEDAGATPADVIDAGGGGNFTPPDAGMTDPSASCSGQPSYLFCDDFDTESTFSQGWGWYVAQIDGGTSGFFSGAYTSPSRSLQVTAPVTGSVQSQLLGLDLGTLKTQIRLAFDLRIDMDSLTNIPNICIAQILGARAGTGMELDYLLRPNQGALLSAPPLRTWTRIVIVYDVSAGITVYEDGQQIGAYASGAGVPNDTKVQVGVVYDNGTSSATLQMEMDNIVVRGH